MLPCTTINPESYKIFLYICNLGDEEPLSNLLIKALLTFLFSRCNLIQKKGFLFIKSTRGLW